MVIKTIHNPLSLSMVTYKLLKYQNLSKNLYLRMGNCPNVMLSSYVPIISCHGFKLFKKEMVVQVRYHTSIPLDNIENNLLDIDERI